GRGGRARHAEHSGTATRAGVSKQRVPTTRASVRIRRAPRPTLRTAIDSRGAHVPESWGVHAVALPLRREAFHSATTAPLHPVREPQPLDAHGAREAWSGGLR